jgi:hypothetical protein
VKNLDANDGVGQATTKTTAGFSTTAARGAAFSRNDKFFVWEKRDNQGKGKYGFSRSAVFGGRMTGV